MPVFESHLSSVIRPKPMTIKHQATTFCALYLPRIVTEAPVRMANGAIVKQMGKRSMPARIGLTPLAAWKYDVGKK